MRAWLGSGLRVAALLGAFGGAVAPTAHALTLTVENQYAGVALPNDPEGIAVIGDFIYVPTKDCGGACQVHVLNRSDGSTAYVFNTGQLQARSVDALPNGNLLLGIYAASASRMVEITIPGNPGTGNPAPTATTPTNGINIAVGSLPGGLVMDEFEALSVIARPGGQLSVLFAEEGRADPVLGEIPGEFYLADITGPTTADISFLFQLPDVLNTSFDDISGVDVIRPVFDASGNVDLANTLALFTDDSSGGDRAGAFIVNLVGTILETLAGPGVGTPTGSDFEDLYGDAFSDPEGVDYDPETQLLTIMLSGGGGAAAAGGNRPVSFLVDPDTFELPPPTPEPAAVLLLGLGLAGLAFVRRSRG